VFSLEGVSEDVAQFTKGCERLLLALTRHAKFSETDKEMICYYCQEIMTHTQSLRDEQEK
jgi:hypothetical protein